MTNVETLGGYRVLKKWLSYREAALLGRPLTADEALDFTKHVRRIAALLALHPQLNAHFRTSTPGSSLMIGVRGDALEGRA